MRGNCIFIVFEGQPHAAGWPVFFVDLDRPKTTLLGQCVPTKVQQINDNDIFLYGIRQRTPTPGQVKGKIEFRPWQTKR